METIDKGKISIVVPVYNSEKTLNRCVDSLLNQTYDNIEIILVNDASKDSSLAIMDEYAKTEPRVISINNEHGGVSHSRNTGVLNSTGKFIMFCDSDDYVGPEWCATLIEMMQENVVLGVCGVNVVKPNGEIRYRNVYKTKYVSTANFFELDENNEFTYVVWDKIFVRDRIKNLFDKSFEFGEDGLFIMEYLKNLSPNEKIATGSDAQYFYDLGGSNRLSDKWRDTHHKFAEERERLACEIAKNLGVEQNILDKYIKRKKESLLMSDISLLASPQNKTPFWQKYRELKTIINNNMLIIDGVNSSSRFVKIVKLKKPLFLMLAYRFYK